MEFLRAGAAIASSSVYSLHKSSTRGFIEKFAARTLGLPPGAAEVVAQLRYDLPATYSFHKCVGLGAWLPGHPEGRGVVGRGAGPGEGRVPAWLSSLFQNNPATRHGVGQGTQPSLCRPRGQEHAATVTPDAGKSPRTLRWTCGDSTSVRPQPPAHDLLLRLRFC